MRRPARVLFTTFRLYDRDHCGTYAAAIAYYAIFSLIPLVLVIVSAFGLFVDRDRIVDFVFEQVPLQQTATVQRNVEDAVNGLKNVSYAGLGFGGLLLLWSSSGIFSAVRKGLNATRQDQDSRSYLRGKVVDFILIFSSGALVIVSIGLTALLQVAFERAGDLGWVNVDTRTAVRIAYYVLPALASFGLFTVVYRFVPTARPRWNEALAGAAFAAVLFELAKNVAALLIAHAPYARDSALYAGFGTALAFLFWTFINASVLLLGAEFARALAVVRAESAALARANLGLPAPQSVLDTRVK